MPIYFMIHDARLYDQEIHPALSASWQLKSFEPCKRLGRILKEATDTFAAKFHTGAESPLLEYIGKGLPFDRRFWSLLVGETFIYAARDIPEFELAPDTLMRLLCPGSATRDYALRSRFSTIEQALYGSKFMEFGKKTYRPERAGLNDAADVQRLAECLSAVNSDEWNYRNLAPFHSDENDCEEELEDAKLSFLNLREMYISAAGRCEVVVCEEIG
jgi:hypothetical protein